MTKEIRSRKAKFTETTRLKLGSFVEADSTAQTHRALSDHDRQFVISPIQHRSELRKERRHPSLGPIHRLPSSKVQTHQSASQLGQDLEHFRTVL